MDKSEIQIGGEVCDEVAFLVSHSTGAIAIQLFKDKVPVAFLPMSLEAAQDATGELASMVSQGKAIAGRRQ